jgi:DNA-binding MarR family transcriptional regulator
LGKPHLDVLFILASEKTLHIKEIARKMHISSPATTQVLDALVSFGLIKRTKNANDQRLRDIQLSEIAEKEINSIKKEYMSSVGEAFEKLNTDELAQLDALLQKLRSNNV